MALVTTALCADRVASLPTCRPAIGQTARRIATQLTSNLQRIHPAGRLDQLPSCGRPASLTCVVPAIPVEVIVHPAELLAHANYRLPPPTA